VREDGGVAGGMEDDLTDDFILDINVEDEPLVVWI